MTISIIIPTFNEEKTISKLLNSIQKAWTNSILEVLIIDSPNSTDNIESLNFENNISVIKSSKPGRAFQMNLGAKKAKGDIFYFVHSDTVLPVGFVNDILENLQKSDLGCFRFKFDSKDWRLKINSFSTRLKFIWCRGGDQTLFIKREVFEALNGYDENYVIMEEYDFIRRAQKKYKFKIAKNSVSVSARKYENNEFWAIQRANFKAMRMFLNGKYSPQEIKSEYEQKLRLKY
ncbi:glycosyltransferase [Lacihabitans sp. LS3-19]|uniref:TIGR04283 family arsenosugar biosynthesis glycosyltransferase n=1 Tax=Lacihabitans sp. LS3-19 TaxID=2487335 RepID=UPI0020CD466E|nr:TIGR04283 family arsenosugar biosynthesis glycosyltransferase [Lacihabitans sp. LS3-19]MCP9768272.1 glycosyltransferase [Lacihabitans sp. LS3-19]